MAEEKAERPEVAVVTPGVTLPTEQPAAAAAATAHVAATATGKVSFDAGYWGDLLRRFLPLLPEDVMGKLTRAVQHEVEDFEAGPIARAYARNLTKHLDRLVNTAVETLPDDGSRTAFVGGLLAVARGQTSRVGDAIQGYLPHHVAVASAVKEFGEKSPQAVQARNNRKVFLAELNQDIVDLANLKTE